MNRMIHRKASLYVKNAANLKELRQSARHVRMKFTHALFARGITEPHQFIQLTYLTKKNLGIPFDVSKKHLGYSELLSIMIAEGLLTEKIERSKLTGYEEIKEEVQYCAAKVATEIASGPSIRGDAA